MWKVRDMLGTCSLREAHHMEARLASDGIYQGSANPESHRESPLRLRKPSKRHARVRVARGVR